LRRVGSAGPFFVVAAVAATFLAILAALAPIPWENNAE
jgi:hypothetical protein